MNSKSRKISAIAKQITDLNLPKDMMDKITSIFYDICRRNNIGMCTKNDDGNMSCANPEWVIGVALFCKMIADEIYIGLLLSAPEDLECC